MKIKQYNFGSVDYGYSLQSKKWEFKPIGSNHVILLPAPGGAKTAHKMAKVINGDVKRQGFYGNLGRANVTKLIVNS